MRYLIRLSAGAAALAFAFAASPVRAGSDHDAARRAVEQGEALPLADILAKLRGSLPGEVIGVELERSRGVWVYEFKVVDPAGRRSDIHVDAGTGTVLRSRTRDR